MSNSNYATTMPNTEKSYVINDDNIISSLGIIVEGHRSRVISRGSKVEVEGQKSRVEIQGSKMGNINSENFRTLSPPRDNILPIIKFLMRVKRHFCIIALVCIF
jgi:hypothetical protein